MDPRLRGASTRRLGVPPGVALLEAVPMFAPLSPDTVERLARKLVRIEVPAGEVDHPEGQASDRFYVIESGSVAVSHGDSWSGTRARATSSARSACCATYPGPRRSPRTQDTVSWPWTATTSSPP